MTAVAESFVETSPRSWAESNLDLTSGEVAMDEAEGDVPGPISIAAAVSVEIEVEESATGSGDDEDAEDVEPDLEGTDAAETDDTRVQARVAVFGDSDFASNAALGIQGNSDLALNTISWLAEQENLISIRPREPEDRRITLTADQQFRIAVTSWFFIPAVVVGAGIYTWWRRR